jgi:hypothetical protein
MTRPGAQRTAAVGLLLATITFGAPPIPPPLVDLPLEETPGKEKAVFAGGCFWGTQSVFQRVKGIISTTVGYSGGSAITATYQQVVTETTGHAESVEVVYDPSRITYGQLLRIYFSVAHDPTQLNRQGPNVGAGDLPDGTRNGPGLAARGGNPGAYFGPGAGPGPLHHYVFEFYALDTKLDLPANTTRDEILKAMDRHVIGKSAWFGRFHTPAP